VGGVSLNWSEFNCVKGANENIEKIKNTPSMLLW
jgi:hypothetical protein